MIRMKMNTDQNSMTANIGMIEDTYPGDEQSKEANDNIRSVTKNS
jgi:hypothetical protein